MWKRKKRAAEERDVVEITNLGTGETQTFKTGDEVDLKIPPRTSCEVCGEIAYPGSRRCVAHRGLVFSRYDVVRGEYETREGA